MSAYALDIQIGDEGLRTISRAKMSVALLEHQRDLDYQIVALMTPATNHLQISWTDAHLVYSSAYAVEAYTVLRINSQSTALSGRTFDFDGSALKQHGTSGLPGAVQFTNSSRNMITAGLARTFKVNGSEAAPTILSAVPVLPNGLGTLQFGMEIMLTLLSGTRVGMVIPSQAIPGYSTTTRLPQSAHQIAAQPPLVLNFSAGSATQTVHFDTANNVFVTGSLSLTGAISQ
ncbi:MAG TPA: hypothetical protein VN112_08545 [Ensifer sp.]|nr:hypothetical protein [Ensifer sp.]